MLLVQNSAWHHQQATRFRTALQLIHETFPRGRDPLLNHRKRRNGNEKEEKPAHEKSPPLPNLPRKHPKATRPVLDDASLRTR